MRRSASYALPLPGRSGRRRSAAGGIAPPTEHRQSARRIRAVVATTVLLAFVLRILLAAVPMSAPTAANAVRVPLCTAEGLKWIDLDPDAPHPPKPQASGSCPWCLAAHGFALLVPVVATPLPIAAAAAVLPAFYRDAPLLRIAARPPPGRGPPRLS